MRWAARGHDGAVGIEASVPGTEAVPRFIRSFELRRGSGQVVPVGPRMRWATC